MAVAAAILVVGSALSAPPAWSTPTNFPDIDSQPSVDPAAYEVKGSHPSNSGWVFSTAAGLRCQDSFIAEIGVFCQVGASDPTAARTFISASVSTAGEVSENGTDLRGDDAYPLLPTGMRLATDNGATCAVLADETLACRTVIPQSWGPNVPNPPDRVYGEHGFVLSPTGATTTF